MSKSILKFGILFSVLSFFSLNLFAQNKCNLQFGIYEFKDDGTAEQFPIKDSKVKLVNIKTNKTLKITDSLTVQNIAEGEYKVTVSKNGFQNTDKEFLVDCGFANAENVVSEVIFLWTGDSKRTFLQFKGNNSFVVSEKDDTKRLNSDIFTHGALLLGKPEYPKAAMAVRARGKVEVQVTINELGYVILAEAVSGHPLLQQSAVDAAKKSKFRMTYLEGIPVKITGIVVYNFG